MAEEIQNTKNRVKISIDGKSFTLVGEESEEHMMQVAAYIDQKMAEVRQKAVAVTIDASLAYVLTSVNVADDYFKEKAFAAELEGRLVGMTERARELYDQVDQLEVTQRTKNRELEEEIVKRERCESKLRALELQVQELEEKLADSEKARIAAENKLDEYMIAMEGQQIQIYHPQKHTNKRRR